MDADLCRYCEDEARCSPVRGEKAGVTSQRSLLFWSSAVEHRLPLQWMSRESKKLGEGATEQITVQNSCSLSYPCPDLSCRQCIRYKFDATWIGRSICRGAFCCLSKNVSWTVEARHPKSASAYLGETGRIFRGTNSAGTYICHAETSIVCQ